MRTRYNQFDSKVTPPDRTREVHESFKCTVYYRDTDNNSGQGDNAQVAYWYGPWEDAPEYPADDSWTDLSVRLKDPRWPGTDKFDRACDKIAMMITDGTFSSARVQLNDHRDTIDEHDLEIVGRERGFMDIVELTKYQSRIRRSAGYGPDDEDEALAWDDADRIVDIDDSPSVDVDDMTLFPGSYL